MVRTEIAGVLAGMAVLAFSCALIAQQITVLKNVKVIVGTGAPLERSATVIIEGERLRSISTGQTQAPSNARVVDMNGQTIMPLIINTHGHLGR